MICESCGTHVPEGATSCPRCGRSFVAAPAVDLSLAGPQDQNRWTVFFRWILAIPQLIWVGLVGIAAFFAVIAGWFAALVLGRLPEGIRTFLARVLNQYVRVYAYGQYLLSGRYPPFTLDDPDYDVAVLLHAPTRLNRAAVLFRIVLGIPAFIVVQILSTGVPVVMFFVWVMVLVKKRPSDSVFMAMASILRYQARAYAWFMLLTPEYPRGLSGDKPAPALIEDPDAPPVEFAAGAPRITRLVLSKAAKRIVVLTIVIGVVFGVGIQIVSAVTSAQGDRALRQLEDAYGDLDDASNEFVSRSQSCAITGGPECLQEEIGRFRVELEAFLAALQDIEMPQAALPYAAEVEEEGGSMLATLFAMQMAGDEDEYLRNAEVFQDHAIAFDDAYARLYDVLYFR